LGGAYSQLQRHTEAVYAFGNASALRPNHTEARRFIGEECAQIEDFACAITQLKEAARLFSLRSFYGGCQIWSSLGGAYMEVGMFPEAKRSFEAVLQRCDCANHPNPALCARDPMLLVDLGLAELAVGDAAGANASLHAAIELDAGLADSGVMPDLLLARAMLGDLSAAADALQLYADGKWLGGTPVHLAALGLPAASHLQLASDYVAQRRMMAHTALTPTAMNPVVLPASHPEQWLKMSSSSAGVMRVGFLVCSTALRGADMQVLFHLCVCVSARLDMQVLFHLCVCVSARLDMQVLFHLFVCVSAHLDMQVLYHLFVRVHSPRSWESNQIEAHLCVAVLGALGARRRGAPRRSCRASFG